MKGFQPSVQLPDENGNYHLYLSFLNTLIQPSTDNKFFFFTPQCCEDILKENSIINNKLKNTGVFGELNKSYSNNFTDLKIDMEKVCCKVSGLYLDYNLENVIEEPGAIGLVGLVKPFGPNSKSFENDLKDPNKYVRLYFRGVFESFEQNNTVFFTKIIIIAFDYQPIV